MNKTFKDYLIELDQGDFQLGADNMNKKSKEKEFNFMANKFKDDMNNKTNVDYSKSLPGEPEKGDLILNKDKKYVVINRSDKGFKIQELGNKKKELILKHGYKYSEVDKTTLGKIVYKLSK